MLKSGAYIIQQDHQIYHEKKDRYQFITDPRRNGYPKSTIPSWLLPRGVVT